MDELAKRFADLAEKYGPSVVDAALQAARIEAWHALVFNLFGIAFGVGLLLIARRLWNIKTKDARDRELPRMAAVFIGIVGSLVAFFATMFTFDPWLWTTLQHPELWIAKRVIGI